MRIKILAAAGMAGVALVAGLAGTASAASYNGVCESSGGGEACLYRYDLLTGALYDTLYSKSDYGTSTYYGTSVEINNSVSSAENMDPDTALKLWQYGGYSGQVLVIPAGSSIGNFVIPDFDNRASSHCFVSNAACP